MRMDNSGSIELRIKLFDAVGIKKISIGTGRITIKRSKI
jgi:hypothetical protein